jgi:hypothetical protein
LVSLHRITPNSWLSFHTEIRLDALLVPAAFAIFIHNLQFTDPQKYKRFTQTLRLWPLLAVLCLVAMVAVVAVSGDNLIERMGNFTFWSAAVFATTLGFGFASVISVLAILSAPEEGVRPGVRRFSWIVSVALLIATAYLAYYGIIGLRTWA